jgi:hypothetical protein
VGEAIRESWETEAVVHRQERDRNRTENIGESMETKAFTVKLTLPLARALEEEAAQRGCTPTEMIRSAIVAMLRPSEGHPNGKQPPQGQDLQRRILEETLITRSLLLRLSDRSSSRELSDKMLDAAVRDAAAALAAEEESKS